MLPDTNRLREKLYSRRELQHFCQQFGIKANGKNDDMYAALLQRNQAIQDEQLQQIRQSQAAAELRMSVSLAKSQFDADPPTEELEVNDTEVVEMAISEPEVVLRLCESDSTSRSQESCEVVSGPTAQQAPYSPPQSSVQVYEGHESCAPLLELIEEYRRQAKLLLKHNFDRKIRQFQRQAQAEITIIPPEKRLESVDIQACAGESTDLLKNVTQRLDFLINK